MPEVKIAVRSRALRLFLMNPAQNHVHLSNNFMMARFHFTEAKDDLNANPLLGGILVRHSTMEISVPDAGGRLTFMSMSTSENVYRIKGLKIDHLWKDSLSETVEISLSQWAATRPMKIYDQSRVQRVRER